MKFSRTLKSTKTKEYLNQSFPGVLKRLHTVGFWASALDIYHGMLSQKMIPTGLELTWLYAQAGKYLKNHCVGDAFEAPSNYTG